MRGCTTPSVLIDANRVPFSRLRPPYAESSGVPQPSHIRIGIRRQLQEVPAQPRELSQPTQPLSYMTIVSDPVARDAVRADDAVYLRTGKTVAASQLYYRYTALIITAD